MLVISESLRSHLIDCNSKCKLSKWILSGRLDSRLLKIGNYFTFRERTGLISYCPAGRTQLITDDGTWKREGREGIKPGKLIRRILPNVNFVRDTDVEKFTNLFKAAEAKVTFKLLSGKDNINQAYDEVECDSCMRGDPVGEFYHNMGAKILVCGGDGETLGRAIVWNAIINGKEGCTFMDRVYSKEGREGEIVVLFANYAESQGWYRKARQSSDSKDEVITPEGVMLSYLSMKVVGNDSARFYPYLDTFSYGGDGYITNDGEGDMYEYQQTDGTREDDEHEGEIQLANGDWVNEDDACMVGDEWYHVDDCVMCHRSDEWILSENAYCIEISRHETVYIHEDYVNRAS